MLTCCPQLVSSFIYRGVRLIDVLRRPADLIKAMVARDLIIAETFCRHFWWHTLMLWPEELSTPTVLLLANGDDLVPCELVQRQIQAQLQRRLSQEDGISTQAALRQEDRAQTDMELLREAHVSVEGGLSKEDGAKREGFFLARDEALGTSHQQHAFRAMVPLARQDLMPQAVSSMPVDAEDGVSCGVRHEQVQHASSSCHAFDRDGGHNGMQQACDPHRGAPCKLCHRSKSGLGHPGACSREGQAVPGQRCFGGAVSVQTGSLTGANKASVDDRGVAMNVHGAKGWSGRKVDSGMGTEAGGVKGTGTEAVSSATLCTACNGQLDSRNMGTIAAAGPVAAGHEEHPMSRAGADATRHDECMRSSARCGVEEAIKVFVTSGSHGAFLLQHSVQQEVILTWRSMIKQFA
jgi:hypothetical protein